MNLVDRIKGILLQPKSEWSKIESEPGDAGYLLSNYVAILAAIPPICTFIGTSIIVPAGILASAMKVSAYAPTAAWLAGVFYILPALSILAIFALYGLYLLYTGITT